MFKLLYEWIYFIKEEKGKKNSDLQPPQLSSTRRPCHKVYIEGQNFFAGVCSHDKTNFC